MSNSLTEKTPSLGRLQVRIVFLTYLSYFTYYFGRRYFGIITPTLIEEGVLSKNQIGLIQTSFLTLYAIGQFVSGALGDKIGPRRMIFFGMLASGVAALIIGILPWFGVILIAFSLNGLAQSTGWSNNCKLISSWIPEAKRGRLMGVWMTCYILGGIAANSFTGYLLGTSYSWKYAVFACSIVMLLMAIVQGVFLINRPEDVGLTLVGQRKINVGDSSGKSNLMRMLTHPVIQLYGVAYFTLKFIRDTIFAWFPLFLVEVKGFSGSDAAYASNGFDVGGFVGILLGGVLADTVFRKNKCRLAMLALLGLAVACFSLKNFAQDGFWVLAAGLAGIGFFLYMAESILSGTAAQDIGGVECSASATGVVNGIGSLGGALSGILPIWIQQKYGWSVMFMVFMVLALIAMALLIPLAIRGSLRNNKVG